MSKSPVEAKKESGAVANLRRFVRLTDGFAIISESVIAQDPHWVEHWRDCLSVRSRALYGKRNGPMTAPPNDAGGPA